MLTGLPPEHTASARSPYGSMTPTMISCASIWEPVVFLTAKENEIGAFAYHPPGAEADSGVGMVRGVCPPPFMNEVSTVQGSTLYPPVEFQLLFGHPFV